MTILVDQTHLRNAAVTGIERITLELFSAKALAPLPTRAVGASSAREMVIRQQAELPWLMAKDRRALLITSGFPAAPLLYPFRDRVLPYVHDTFLISRWHELNPRAKAYMSPSFRLMARTYPFFFVNSEATEAALRRHARKDAEIMLFRPQIENVFGVRDASDARPDAPKRLKLLAIGTIEPRKNYRGAAAIVAALRDRGIDASLDIVGRDGWGDDGAWLDSAPGVRRFGYQPADAVRRMLEEADALILTSNDEGLGLPLIEAQYAGLLVIATDIPVFREVLGSSGALVDPGRPAESAARIEAAMARPDWRRDAASAARSNILRWNGNAARDRDGALRLITERHTALQRGVAQAGHGSGA